MSILKIGVFYDGNYFLQASNYYAYGHSRSKRLSVNGLHQFIRHQASQLEETPIHSCKIVDAHYFRGRLNAYDASQRGDLLFWDRAFDDILMAEGVNTHYIPVKINIEGQKIEKGLEVYLSLEALEITRLRNLDLAVIIAGDGVYTPLAKKIMALGTKVMVLGWDIEYVNENNNRIMNRVSAELMNEANFPLLMNEIIDQKTAWKDDLVNNLFVANESKKPTYAEENMAGEGRIGEILSLKNGFGFIKFPPNNVFFHFSNLVNSDFQDLQVGDQVMFDLEKNEDGQDIAKNVRMLMTYN